MFNGELQPIADQIMSRRALTDGFVGRRTGGKPWPTYDSSIFAYQLDLDQIIPDVDLVDFVAQRTNPVVVDFMASSAAIRDLFTKTVGGRGVGLAVSYEDTRSPDQKLIDRVDYNIVQLKGDLTDFKTWRKVSEEMGGLQADLIMQRGRAGVDSMPVHRAFYNKSRRHLWAMLNNNGLLVTQVHNEDELRNAGIDLKSWINQLASLGIEADYVPGVPVERRTLKDDCYGLIKIVKTIDSPKLLPKI